MKYLRQSGYVCMCVCVWLCLSEWDGLWAPRRRPSFVITLHVAATVLSPAAGRNGLCLGHRRAARVTNCERFQSPGSDSALHVSVSWAKLWVWVLCP